MELHERVETLFKQAERAGAHQKFSDGLTLVHCELGDHQKQDEIAELAKFPEQVRLLPEFRAIHERRRLSMAAGLLSTVMDQARSNPSTQTEVFSR